MTVIIEPGTIPRPIIHNRLESIWEDGNYHRVIRQRKRLKPAIVRLWDGDWRFVGTLGDLNSATFQWKYNDTGVGTVSVPLDSWAAKWVIDHKKRSTKNVHITMDKDGARWSGRLQSFTISKNDGRRRELIMTFLHDYEELKHIYVWPNPHLPAAVQFPRAFSLVGPTAWVLRMALFLNIHRLAGNKWALPDDPFDIFQWDDAWRPQDWPIMVNPKTLELDPTPWTVISSRMKTWHDLAAPKLADAQLMVTTRRWLEGDEPPWGDYKPRNGQLIVDLVDKSGFWSPEGTSWHGTIWQGMIRTVQSVVGAVDTEETVIETPDDIPAYRHGNWFGTEPHWPYVTYRDGDISGITSSDFTWQPATSVQELTGGKSSYGVNEAISTAVQIAGNYFGAVIGLFSLGGIADKVLAPIYSDTILAWMSIKSHQRTNTLGWSHYYEHFAEGADQAYTLSSIIALRQGFWETRERTSHRITLADGAPWFIGDNGEGHFFLGDRIGSTIVGLPDGETVVEQVMELEYTIDRSNTGWSAICGDPTSQQSPLETALGKIRDAAGAIHDQGVI